MTGRWRLLLGSCLPLLLAACTVETPAPGFEVLDEPPPGDALRRAQQAAGRLGRTLLERLSDELDRGGPATAVKVCSEVAPGIARELSEPDLAVRRVSEKVRNTQNRPDEYELAKLQELAELHREGRTPVFSAEVVRSERGRELRFLKPLVVGDACLACHGPREQLDPAVIDVIAGNYPEDEATGYSTGDFRGAISVTVALKD